MRTQHPGGRTSWQQGAQVLRNREEGWSSWQVRPGRLRGGPTDRAGQRSRRSTLGRAEARRRLPERLSEKTGLSMNGAPKIVVGGPRFFSARDEDCFFSWLHSIVAVRAVRGAGTDLEITLAVRLLSQRDLREILALFYRYGIDMRSLRHFDSPRVATWFRDPKAYWHVEVFGTRRSASKRL